MAGLPSGGGSGQRMAGISAAGEDPGCSAPLPASSSRALTQHVSSITHVATACTTEGPNRAPPRTCRQVENTEGHKRRIASRFRASTSPSAPRGPCAPCFHPFRYLTRSLNPSRNVRFRYYAPVHAQHGRPPAHTHPHKINITVLPYRGQPPTRTRHTNHGPLIVTQVLYVRVSSHVRCVRV